MTNEQIPVYYWPNNTLHFLASGLKKTYGVIQKVSSQGSETQIHYEMDVLFSGADKDNNKLYVINRKQVYINETAPDTLIEQLADKSGSCLFPLHIKTDNRGKFTDVLNHGIILQKWAVVKKELELYFVGEIANGLLNKIDYCYNNPFHLSEHLQNDWFIKLFFAPIYTSYSPSFQLTGLMRFPLFPFSKPISFLVDMKADDFIDETGKFNIAIDGICVDERSVEDILLSRPVAVEKHLSNNYILLQGEVKWNYRLFSYDRSIFSIVGYAELTLKAGQKKNVQIEIYQLGGEQVAPPPPKRVFSVLFDD